MGFYIGPNLFLSERCDGKRKWGKTVGNIGKIEDEEMVDDLIKGAYERR